MDVLVLMNKNRDENLLDPMHIFPLLLSYWESDVVCKDKIHESTSAVVFKPQLKLYLQELIRRDVYKSTPGRVADYDYFGMFFGPLILYVT